MQIPVFYDYNNAYNSQINPSTVHVQNTGLQRFFQRYLLEKAISIFDWTLPDNWAKNYFSYILYCYGYLAVVRTDKYGVICQQCGLQGYDIYYQPTRAVIANSLLTGILSPRIGTQCEIIKMQPDYGGIMDIVDFYADMLALSAESAGMNLVNSKLAYVFAADGKSEAESFKKLFDKISGGNPAVFADSKLFTADGKLKMEFFNQNLKNTYIASEILDDMRKWEMKFDNEIGIPTVNTVKKERLITDEATTSVASGKAKIDLWFETLSECVEKVNRMFNIGIAVKKHDWGVREVENNGV